MTEDRRLRDKLAKLAAEAETVEDGRRRLSPGAAGLLAAMLAEIDETVLGRRITFETDGGRRLSVEVANRRLLRMSEAPDENAGPEGLLGPLGPDTDGILPAVVAAMRRLGEGQDSLLVATVPLDAASKPDVLGRSVAALARATGIDLYSDTAPAEASGGFSASVSGLAVAVRRFAPSPSAPTGAQAGRLEALDEDGLRQILGQIGPKGARAGRFILLSGDAVSDALFVGCETEDATVAALVPATRSGEVIALWRATRDGG